MEGRSSIVKTLIIPALVVIGSCSLYRAGSGDFYPESFISSDSTIVIRNVHVIPVDREGVDRDQTVILSGGKIQHIYTSEVATLPDSAVIIDGSGKYLMPGLLDMHVHMHSGEPSKFLSHGITTVRNMWGTPDIKELISQIEEGTIAGPAIYSASPGIDGTPPTWGYTQIIEDPAEAPALVERLKEDGWEFLKVYNRLKPGVYMAIAKAAKKENIRFLGHAPLAVPIEDVLSAEQATVEHFTGYDRHLGGSQGFHAWTSINEANIPGIAEKTAGTETWNCPTLAVLDALTERNMGESSRRQAEENRFKLLKALHENRARLLIGTDAGVQLIQPGESLHEEMRKFYQAGFTPFEIIRIATLEGAKFLDIDDQIGTVSVGKQADLILLDENPLEKIEHTLSIEGVILDGAWYSKSFFEE